MKNLAFDFIVDKPNNTITVTREFNAPLPLVWKAWTTAELLDQWWAPKPWKANTKSMDFREGGRWLYNMTGPEGEIHWSLADYKTIDAKKSFRALDAFCDEDGNIKEDWGRSDWNNSFSADGERTTVTIQITFDKLETLENHIQMGFKEGFTAGLDNLDELLEKLS
jgi:uncharacterized protein YndB with AHSA1/START domain